MVLSRGAWAKHRDQFWSILGEIATVKDPEQLAAIAAERKPRMFLLPYGIPIAIGTIAYFAWSGMLVGIRLSAVGCLPSANQVRCLPRTPNCHCQRVCLLSG